MNVPFGLENDSQILEQIVAKTGEDRSKSNQYGSQVWVSHSDTKSDKEKMR